MNLFPFILIHSPLVGTFTWQSVGGYLRTHGYQVLIPDLKDDALSDKPYWQQEVDSINLSVQDPVVVGHSGCGALLPAIGKKLDAQALVYVDAVLLFQPMTRLDIMRHEDAQFAEEFEAYLQAGGAFPEWTDDDLRLSIPDDSIRQKLIADLRPRSLAFFTEEIPITQQGSTVPCGYIQLSESYTSYATEAESCNWAVKKQLSHHFEMLSHPTVIGQLIIDMTNQLLNLGQ